MRLNRLAAGIEQDPRSVVHLSIAVYAVSGSLLLLLPHLLQIQSKALFTSLA
ncbi:MAG: hypothetical protein IPP40_15590 [bacterium]|nr:hypothetical protein [bacterium]